MWPQNNLFFNIASCSIDNFNFLVEYKIFIDNAVVVEKKYVLPISIELLLHPTAAEDLLEQNV